MQRHLYNFVMEQTKEEINTELKQVEKELAKKPNNHKLRQRFHELSAKAKAKTGKAGADFKKFAFKGNIIDLAIAVIIGAAFGKIIASLVADIIMPGIGALIGEVDFSQLKIVLKSGDPEVAIRYGAFIQTIFEFFVIAFSIYLVFKLVMLFRNRAEKKRIANALPPAPPALTKTEQFLSDIKDLLESQKTPNA